MLALLLWWFDIVEMEQIHLLTEQLQVMTTAFKIKIK
jgi:hypothetical protein